MTDENLQNADELEGAAPSEEELKPTDVNDDGQEQHDEEAHADDDAARRNKVPAGKRIRQLTRKFRDAERENEELRNRLKAVEERLGPPPAPARPVRDDFNSDQEYEDALFDWRDSTKQQQTQKAPKQEAAPAVDPELQKLADEFEEEIESLTEKLNDDEAYDLVMNGDWNCTKDMFDYILASEVRAEMAYHLAKNPDLSKRISGMSPILAARELAKVEADVASNLKNGATPPKDTLPPPISQTKPVSAPIANADKMSTKQWVEARRKQMAERSR